MGERVGGGTVSISSERDARLVQQELQDLCQFTVSCGCGFHLKGPQGVKLFQQAEQHFRETGHGAFGHFTFGAGVGGDE